jgi:predicted adenine nucleotide alpha hydrolase (AANH) superfamily ATPase
MDMRTKPVMAEYDELDRLFDYVKDLARALESGKVMAVCREAEHVVRQAEQAKSHGFRARKALE